MVEEYTIALAKVIKELGLSEVYLPRSADEILIKSRDVNRPGVELNSYCEYFDPNRITILGRSEIEMLKSFGKQRRRRQSIISLPYIPPVIVARGIESSEDMLAAAKKYDIPLLSSGFHLNVVADLVSLLNVELAPRITRHGVLIEVYGEGILLVGDSGVGKK